jgi:hypothetical protein
MDDKDKDQAKWTHFKDQGISPLSDPAWLAEALSDVEAGKPAPAWQRDLLDQVCDDVLAWDPPKKPRWWRR